MSSATHGGQGTQHTVLGPMTWALPGQLLSLGVVFWSGKPTHLLFMEPAFFLALGVALVNGKVGRWPRLGRDLGTHHISWAAVPE